MDTRKSELLRVPGASLSYTVRGSGPLLFMIAGGGGMGGTFERIANHLAAWYTIVTYDRRGISDSTIDNPDEEVSVQTHSNDAHLLLAHLSQEPAYVFGSSAGALIGLDLVAHHGQQVQTLVAHEPPTNYLLSTPDSTHGHLFETYRREGAVSALRQFSAQLGITYQDLEPGAQVPQWSTRSDADAKSFFKYTFPAVQRYQLDFPALLKTPANIVIAGGETGQALLGYRSAVVVAERIGTTVVEFPGHHAGYVSYPQTFAEKLHNVLSH